MIIKHRTINKYFILKQIGDKTEESVHYKHLPISEQEFINETVERRVAAMRTVIETVRTLRERKAISIKVCFCVLMKSSNDNYFLVPT